MVPRKKMRTAQSQPRQKVNVPTRAQLEKMRQAWRDLREGLEDLDIGIKRFRESLNGSPFFASRPKK